MGFRIDWGVFFRIIAVSLVAAGLGVAARLVVPWPLAAVCVVVLGYTALMRLGLLEKRDIVELGRALVPEGLQPLVFSAARLFLEAVYG